MPDKDRRMRSEKRGGRGGGRGAPRGRKHRKVCVFCVSPRDNIIDYKNINLLKRFVDDDARIRKARQTGTCRKHQNRIAAEIKVAREVALLPYVPE